jgi:CO/xanthine dehydrogenase Mo-binding subunit
MTGAEKPRRPEAIAKVRGQARFLRDSDLTGRLVGGCLRSPHAHARINALDASPARDVQGVRAVLTAKDLPGRNVVPLIQTDWPILAQDYVRHVGEGVVLVAADTTEALEEALRAIVVEYEPLPATLDMETALQTGEVVAQVRLKRGEAAVALGQSNLEVVEAIYETPYQDHTYLEPQGVFAAPDGAGGVRVLGTFESLFAVERAAATALGWDLHRVRVIQLGTGSGCGGREETPAFLGAEAALLAVATDQPVAILLSREEDMLVTTKRHPARIRCRTGATKDGYLLAAEVDCLLDGGAYATLSPVVLQRAAQSACGPYRIPNVHVSARVVRTHNVPAGAFLGSGEAQVVFAAESQMDLLAERLGMDPLELRLRNTLAPGDTTITGRKLGFGVGPKDVLERVAVSADWERKRALFGQDEGVVRRGIGLAVSHSGAALPQSGRGVTCASVLVFPDGSVQLGVGRGDANPGLARALTQVASETLRCPAELIHLVEGDTSRVPDFSAFAGPASLVVDAVRDASLRVRASMDAVTADAGFGWKESVDACVRRRIPLLGYGSVRGEDATDSDDEAAQGTFAATIVEVEVDTHTGETHVLHVHSVHEAGRVLDPTASEAQIEGGVVFGLGLALLEGQRPEEGRNVKTDLGSYLLPTARDAPDIHAILLQQMDSKIPDGAKGLAEAALIAVPAGVASAIANAVGVRLQELPTTPELIRAALRAREGQ